MKLLISFQRRFVLILFLSFLVELLLTQSKLIHYTKHEIVFFYSILFTLPILIVSFYIRQEIKYHTINDPNKYILYETGAAFLLAAFSSVQFLRTFYSELPLSFTINGIVQLSFLCISFLCLAVVEILKLPQDNEEEE